MYNRIFSSKWGACCLFLRRTWPSRNYDLHPVNPWGLATLLLKHTAAPSAGVVPKTLVLHRKMTCTTWKLHCISSLSMWILVLGKHISHRRHNSAIALAPTNKKYLSNGQGILVQSQVSATLVSALPPKQLQPYPSDLRHKVPFRGKTSPMKSTSADHLEV